MTSDFKPTSIRESSTEDAVIAWAANHGWKHRFMSYRGRRGCLDSYFFGFGTIVIMEFKKKGKSLDPLQVREHAMLREAGLRPWVVWDTQTGIDILKAAMK